MVLAGLATVLASGMLAVLPAQVASAATVTVTNCNGTGPGSLAAAVTTAGSGDTITFSVSCPAATPIVLAGTIDITKSLTVTGPGSAQLVVCGNNAFQVFHVAAGITVTISGITIEKGAANNGCGSGCGSSGGGIENLGTLTVANADLRANSVNDGCNDSCGADGGGIENDGGGNLTVTDSTIRIQHRKRRLQ